MEVVLKILYKDNTNVIHNTKLGWGALQQSHIDTDQFNVLDDSSNLLTCYLLHQVSCLENKVDELDNISRMQTQKIKTLKGRIKVLESNK